MQPQPSVKDSAIAKLNAEIDEYLHGESRSDDKEKASRRIQLIFAGLARKLKLDGEVKMFGSFSNGFRTGTSDLDVVFIGKVGVEKIIRMLGDFALELPHCGLQNVTRIFQANVPLVKVTDVRSGMEVDFCINNELGVRNSLLLRTYCQYDERVLQLGRLVKDWAKKHSLVGTADGCLNSYAYMLLTIHFLQALQPPVVPNLQALATGEVKITDSKWGGEDYWETKFVDDVSSLPPTENTQSVGELLVRFFHFYAFVFDWRAHAVCMRLNKTGETVDKFSLLTNTNADQWYIEDPFDLKHNLAGKCTLAGRTRIQDEMRESLSVLRSNGSWAQVCPPTQPDFFYLKCRISQAVSPQALLEEFEEFDLFKLHFPKPDGTTRMAQAFLEFSCPNARRRAHTKNEHYVADCQLQLHYTSLHCLTEAVKQGNFSTYEMASYKMQRTVLNARVQGVQPTLPMVAPGAPNTQSRQQMFPDPAMNPGMMQPGNMMPDAQYGFYGGPRGPSNMQRQQMAMQGMSPWDMAMPKQAGDAAQAAALAQHKAMMAMPKQGMMSVQQMAQQGGMSMQGMSVQQIARARAVDPKMLGAGAAPFQGKAMGAKAPGPQMYDRTAGSQPKQSVPKSGSRAGAWLQVPVEMKSQSGVQVFSDEQNAKIRELLSFYKEFSTVKGAVSDRITLQVEVKDSLPPQQKDFLSGEDWKKIDQFRVWGDKYRA